ncbi:MAG: hypothetical protein ACI8XO_002573 [Verrucomicrobiales bacterium]|jgi:hypothetical protein
MNLRKCRISIGLVIVGLIISGVTAFPLLSEMNLISRVLVGEGGSLDPADHADAALTNWILTVREGLDVTYAEYPFIAYGTDWLAFGHIIIALFYILPYHDPLRYRGVLFVGVIASLLVIPLALICGEIRGIPFGWRLIDCSFGILCLLPLGYAIRESGRASGET